MISEDGKTFDISNKKLTRRSVPLIKHVLDMNGYIDTLIIDNINGLIAVDIIELLSINKTVKSVSLSNNQFTSFEIKSVVNALGANQTIEEIKIIKQHYRFL